MLPLHFLLRSTPATLLFCLLFAASEQTTAQVPPLFRLVPPSESNLTFANPLIESDTFYMGSFIYAYNGAGVAIGDVDGDERPDIYIVGTQSHAPSRLYRNLGDLRFEDVTERAGLVDSTGVRFGVAMVDIDGDGDLDIHVARQFEPNRMYVNDGSGRFVDKAAELGLDFCCSSTRGLFFDYDRDGDLDLYLGVNGNATAKNPMMRGLPDRFYRNDDGRFVEVTEEVGIYDVGYCLSVTVGDYDDDGWPDVYVTNDFQERDQLYMNNGDGTFTDRMVSHMRYTSTSSMGSDVGDLDGDGRLDIIAVDMVPEDHARKFSNQISLSTYSPVFDSTQQMRNTFQLNRGRGFFSEVAQMTGIPDTDWSWGPLIADYDNDGDADFVITNGFKRDVLNLDIIEYVNLQNSPMQIMRRVPLLKLPNYAYRNDGNLQFTRIDRQWGLDQVVNSNGIARGDLDGDGDLEIVLNNLDSTMMLLENRADELDDARYFRIRLEAAGKNTFGVGARVVLHADEMTQTLELTPARSYLSSVEPILHFGLGEQKRVDSLRVRWPDGSWEVFEKGWSADRTIRLVQRSGRPCEPPPSPETILTSENGSIDIRQPENNFLDFYRQRLLPRRYSRNGPAMAAGDIDGDRIVDLWIAGPANQGGVLLRGDESGNYAIVDAPALVADNAYEDQGGLLFDVDADGDLDLYVVSGGTDNPTDSTLWIDRLYLNDGTGSFERSEQSVPAIPTSGSSVAAADIDDDGDLDLAVGGRVVPDHYPDAPQSLLLRNDGGTFVDVTATLAPEFERIGMVSSLIFTDVDGDADPDIVLVGEWMEPTILINDGGRFARSGETTGFEGLTGWWNSVVGGDFDEDGDIDYVLGNIGLNTKSELRPSQDEPVRLYANDFDRNGSRELIMSYVRGGYELPVRSRADVAAQMGTYIKRKFPTTTRYALSKLDQIYEPELLAEADRHEATTFASLYAENLGDGTFRVRELPRLAQIAPIHGMVAHDVDADGYLDLLLVDNFHGPDGSAVLYGAGLGLMLRGDGSGGFEPVDPLESGFRVGCDARALVVLPEGKGRNEPYSVRPIRILASCNNVRPAGFVDERQVLSIDPGSRATHAIITFEDGRSRREEFHVGSGYLSDSPDLILLPEERAIERIDLYRGRKLVESIDPGELPVLP